ncbi:ATP-dependent helicase [Youhaiella tibetensis]|uniref:ATP-dependent helicase HrpB n=1 Tax=Paradevosia tibetensis TaxID=1447062 RepID=A0A5B9DT95_9HYPH|nr:ATP-dependent helicase HrpB [Youhaiella tibetensis]QEE22009.1 ATP-dependent helicase HrpB [Youhaiella tibetensis]GGF46170.1 ATP-dependent helicase [Youhaiella tibetensis]
MPLLSPLPIDAALPLLLAALEAGPFAVLVAPPGAGKTTRVPLALLDAPWRGDGRIVMLEPRRLAARAAARRMAQTLGEEVGETVGYRVRLDNKITRKTRIEVVTEGVFTRMLLDDPELTGIAAVLFDEFHERSLDGDLGLALALDAAALREDLRLLVMSATIDGARVARLLGDAPVIESEGRAFPVETRYVVPDPLARLEDQVTAATLEAMNSEPGSALVFLPGQAEITRTAERLAGKVPANTDIAPLYGQLTPAEQDRAVQPAPRGRRKIVLATSIAETSLTIEGVRIVIDSGFRRVPTYEPATGLSSLETRRVSRAAADQRRGRAGRTEPGICFRLWNEGQNSALDAFDTPEILAADLSGLALDLASWGVTDPKAMAFLDSPPAPAWSEAVTLLKGLEALDAQGRITPEGRALARLPLHPRLAHMVHCAAGENDALTAAEIAVLLGERGLGGAGIDLAHRLDRFRRESGRRAEEARNLARRWAALVGNKSGSGEDAGRHLARAYPDRVAQASGARGRFRLANGRAASLEETDALAAAPYLVVADLTGSAANGRIRAAAAIDRATIEELFAGQITSETVLAFDKGARSLRARRIRRLGALRLTEEPLAVPTSEEAARLLAAGLAETGIAALPWSKDQNALRARSTYLHQTLGDAWPDLSDPAIAQDGAATLAPYLSGHAGLADLSADDLAGFIEEVLPWARRAEMDKLLPSHFAAPSGSNLPIDYAGENGPTLEIRVQELFGLDRHPAVAGGKVPLLLVLLSPAHRPIQTTRDLPGFWRGSWKDVAKDLKGRYPKHYWPDDPLAAQATARAKPRGT